MEHHKNQEDITLDQYRALLDTLSDAGLRTIQQLIKNVMPKKHASADTFYAIVLHIATKAMCLLFEHDLEARKRATDHFCETLPKLVKDVVVIQAVHGNKNKH